MRWALISACAAVGGRAAPAMAQPARPTPPAVIQAQTRFEGSTTIRTAGRTDSVRVEIRLWSIAGGQRTDTLATLSRGLLIAELRGGRLTTIIDGRRVERRLGEIWSVPAGRRMRVETDDDTATLQTTVVVPR